MSEYAFLDTFPSEESNGFSGAWSVYPFFASGTVIVSDISRGLFIPRPRFPAMIHKDIFDGIQAF